MRRAVGGHNQLSAPANWTTLDDDTTHPPMTHAGDQDGKAAVCRNEMAPWNWGGDSGGDGGRWRENRPQRWGTVEKGLWDGNGGMTGWMIVIHG